MQKGFPKTISQSEIEEFWNGLSDKIKAVRIRRFAKENERVQKDSCFVEFADEAERDRVVELKPKHGEKELKVETMYV